MKEVFESFGFVGNDRLLDIECGKGVVLRVAAAYPFETVSGIEIDTRLIDIAIKNFQVLGMEGIRKRENK